MFFGDLRILVIHADMNACCKINLNYCLMKPYLEVFLTLNLNYGICGCTKFSTDVPCRVAVLELNEISYLTHASHESCSRIPTFGLTRAPAGSAKDSKSSVYALAFVLDPNQTSLSEFDMTVDTVPAIG
eukprot:SAG31_NODE_95_length_25901_cov_24.763700_31_plen_129_part_00